MSDPAPSTPTRPNVLLVMSDQHNPRAAGFAGHPHVLTPAMDALAARGTTFTGAYCSSPICVPSRASIATGRPVHELGTWDNSAPYTGGARSWGHVLGEAGYRVTTIGKLHYRSSEDDTGFPDQRLAMHVHRGGDLRGVSLRPQGQLPPRTNDDPVPAHLLNVGRGESEYTRFDRAVAGAAVDFLRRETDEGPWALMVSFVAPHFPLVAPTRFFDLYDPDSFELPAPDSGAWDHPSVDAFRRGFGLNRPLTEAEQRKVLHAYFALCSFLDARVGQVLAALRASGHDDDTLVVYTSDHGESAGAHGLWFKHLMNEESAGVPLIVAGPGIRAGARVDTPVSQVDLFTTFADWAGLSDPQRGTPGRSLLEIAAGATPERTVLSEYHANGSVAATFMVRDERYKYIHHVGMRPQLFDLVADPDEMVDLAGEPAHAATLERMHRALLEHCDPEEVDRIAKADQARRVEEAGGVEAAAAITVPYTPVPGSAGGSG
jgi:choline-sulfatase